ncbi:D-glycerate dehydrogenase [Patescibacteria group bacterium]|nr:D-glycerate dehydrogenase [Patescibacteria group bacterium]
MALIFVTRKIPTVGIEMLRSAGHEVIVSDKDGVLTPEELREALNARPYEGVVSLLTDKIDASVLASAPHVRIVANYAVGFDNITLSDMADCNVTVTNTPGVLTDTVAEFTLSLILAIAKRIPESDQFVRAGKYVGWAPELLLGSDLRGKTLGIVGAGRIGVEVAAAASLGLGMKIIYHDAVPAPQFEARIPCVFHDTIDTLLVEADVVSIHVPLLPETHHLINASRLALMKRTAYLVNTARGPIIDESALAIALQNNSIRGAAIDVFEFEPAVTEVLRTLENVIMTPHIASATTETRDKMSEITAQNLIAFFAGATPPNVVTQNL